MARPLRLHVPGSVHHVMSRGNRRQRIFKDARDYRRFLSQLTAAVDRFDISCLAYCLMPNHYHLLLQPRDLTISRLMQQLNSGYAGWFNRRHRAVGHLFQGRFRAVLVEADVHLLEVLRYIALNPVEAGLARSPDDWQWSSYRATAGLERAWRCLDVELVWGALDPDDERRAQRRFAAIVTEPPIVDVMAGRVLLGSDAFADTVGPLIALHRANTELSRRERFAVRPSVPALLATAVDRTSMNRCLRIAHVTHGYTLREIGRHVGQHTSTVWKRIREVEDGGGQNTAPAEEATVGRGFRGGPRPATKSRSDPNPG